MDKYKKWIFPIAVVLYLAYILISSDYEKKRNSLSYLIHSIPPMPDNMVKGLVILGILIVVSVALYFYFMKAGESDEK